MGGQFKESKERSMDLPDDHIESVNRAIQWLYGKHFDLSPYDSNENATKRCWELAKLEVFAEKWDLAELRRNLIDAVHRHGHAVQVADKFVPPLELVLYVYENTSVESGFRKMMVDWYTWSLTFEWFELPETRSQLVQTPEFAADMTIALSRRLTGADAANPFKDREPSYYYIVR